MVDEGEPAGDVASATSSEENQAPMTSPLRSGLSVLSGYFFFLYAVALKSGTG